MYKIEFNDNWVCRCLDSCDEGVSVTLPHDAMIIEKRSENSKGIHNIGWFEAKDYVYEKHFFLPDDYMDKHIYFEIEGAYKDAEVYVNNEKIGYRPYGYSDFFVDATDAICAGEENEIKIYTYNSDQPNSRWYSGTGLYRPVNMYVCEKEHVLMNGVRISTVSIHPAIIQVEVQATDAGSYQVEISQNQKLVTVGHGEILENCGSGTIQLEIPNAALWSTDAPNLYQCKVIYAKDEVIETFGIRQLGWGRERGITMNGEHVILRGACIHHDNGVLGACAYPEAEERKIRILKENGYNAIRSAHNPCSKALLDACDRLGVLVMDEYTDAWYIHKTANDYVKHMEHWWKTDLKEMVEKDYNHPSVILYSTGNEVAETAQKRGIALTGKMTDYLHQLDDTRPVTCGINIFFNFLSSMGFGVYSDEKAQKEQAEPVGSEFYNTLAGLLGDRVMKMGATLYPCDILTRDAFSNMDIAGYNYGIFRYEHDLKKYPERLILGTETFCKDAYRFWEQAKRNPGIVGDFVWAGMDYMGEAGVGSWEYEDYAPKHGAKDGWLTAGSGRIDILGNPNGEALYTKVALEQTEEIYLAVKPVYQTGAHSPSAWKMTDALPSWSYPGCVGYAAVVEVYARAAYVQLFLNDKLVGKKSLRNDCRAMFHIKYETGKLEAVAYDGAGQEIQRTHLQSATDETVLMIKPEASVVQPRGIVFIPMCYTDEKGIWKPMEKHQISVQTKHGILKGLGNACPYNVEGYQSGKTSTYYGKALAVVQADRMKPVQVIIRDERREYQIEIPVLQ